MGEVRQRHDGPLADAQQLGQHIARVAHGLQCLGQHRIVERLAREVGQVVVGVALHHRQPPRQAQGHVGGAQLEAAALDPVVPGQHLQQQPLAAADVEHARALPHHPEDGAEVLTAGGFRRAHWSPPWPRSPWPRLS
jgi:hypothetical protein